MIWVYVANHGNPRISIKSIITLSSSEEGQPKNVEINENTEPKDIIINLENDKRKLRYINIATTADDLFLPGVIGLIKTTYRNSKTIRNRGNITIKFEIFLTPNQDSGIIKDLFNSQEARDNNWSYRLHLIEINDIEVYKNIRFSWKTGEEKRTVGDSDTPHIYAIHLLVKRLKDVKYVFWIEADTAVKEDIVYFMMKEARTAKERSGLSDSPTIQKEEYGLPGKTFREKYGLAAFPRNVDTLKPSVYIKLKELGFKVNGMPHFNSGILLLNLDLYIAQVHSAVHKN